jgi:hypothetical protein
MELTQKNLGKRLETLQIYLKDPLKFSILSERLHEKGVECSIIVPIVEVVLDFDALEHVDYEKFSVTKYGQRFDFVLDGCFLIEAKPLDANLHDHYEQIDRYLKGNEEILYGILTNGVVYQVWIKKGLLEESGKCSLSHTRDVVKVLEMSLREDSPQKILEVLSLFKRDNYRNSFAQIAAIARKYVLGGSGRIPIVGDDRILGEELRARIKSAVIIEKGVYYDDVVNGRMSIGDRLCYKNHCVEIVVEVTETGGVWLRKGDANVTNLKAAMDEDWAPILKMIQETWSKDDTPYLDPLEIIKKARGKDKLYHKEQYRFEAIH